MTAPDPRADANNHASKGASAHDPILRIAHLGKSFPVVRDGKRYRVHALDDVTLDVRRGEVLGVVGESGSGKTTLGRVAVGLTSADAGEVDLNGQDLLRISPRKLRAARLQVRMVFQDPYASLDPRRTIADSVAETADIHGIFTSRAARAEAIATALDRVGLGAHFASRYPHQLSGGQRQRVGIARAILPEPELVIADEPVSALDVSIQAQVLNLLAELKARLGLTMMFISHDLGVVAKISDRVAVLYLGRLVELGPAREVFARPRHPYTRILTAAIPRIGSGRRIEAAAATGEPPSRLRQITGCPLQDRCPLRIDICATMPPMRACGPGHEAACHRLDETA